MTGGRPGVYSAWWAISDSLRPRETTPITETAPQQPHTCTTTEALLMAALFICTSSTTTYTHLSLYSTHWHWLLPRGDVLSLYTQLGHWLWNLTYLGLACCCNSSDLYCLGLYVSPAKNSVGYDACVTNRVTFIVHNYLKKKKKKPLIVHVIFLHETVMLVSYISLHRTLRIPQIMGKGELCYLKKAYPK